MKWHHVHQRQIEWAGIVLGLAAFWTLFGYAALAVFS